MDIDKKLAGVIPSVQWDDNSRFLHIHILNGTQAYDLTNHSVKVAGTKPDGTIFFNDVKIIDAKEGLIEVVLTEQMNAVAGSVKCDIKLFNAQGLLTTQPFILDVQPSSTMKKISSSTELKTLVKAIMTVKNIEDKVDRVEFTTGIKGIDDRVAALHTAFEELLVAKRSTIWYNARDYQVRGDGSVDDQPKLQQLIELIHAEGGGVLYCPKGIYKLGSQVNWLPNVSLVGDGFSKTIFKPTHNKSVISWYKGRNPFPYCTEEHPLYNCHFRDFEIDGREVTGQYNVDSTGIHLQYLSNCSFQDILIQGTIASGTDLRYLKQVTIKNVITDQCGRGFETTSNTALGGAGIEVRVGTSEDENSTISNCHALGCGSNGILVECVNSGDNTSGNIIITNNVCKNNRGNGIGIKGGKGISIIDNMLWRNKDGIKLYGGKSIDTKISGNISRINSNADFNIDNVKVEDLEISNNTFSGTTILNCTTNSKNIAIKGNNEFGRIAFPLGAKLNMIVIDNNIFSALNSDIISFLDNNGLDEIKGLTISNNVFKQIDENSITDGPINAINLNGVIKGLKIFGNNFSPVLEEPTEEKYKHLALNFREGSKNNLIKNNYRVGGKPLISNVQNFGNSINSYIEGISNAGYLYQRGQGENYDDGSYAVVEAKYRKALLDMSNSRAFKIKFGQTNTCTILYQKGPKGTSKFWSLAYDASHKLFTVKGVGSDLELRIASIYVDKEYKYYELEYDYNGLRLNASDDNKTFKTFKRKTGMSRELTDEYVLTTLAVGGTDSMLFGGLGEHPSDNTTVDTRNLLWNYKIHVPLVVYKTLKHGTIDEARDKIAEYTWNNFGDNKDLIDNVGGYNARVQGTGTLSQVEEFNI